MPNNISNRFTILIIVVAVGLLVATSGIDLLPHASADQHKPSGYSAETEIDQTSQNEQIIAQLISQSRNEELENIDVYVNYESDGIIYAVVKLNRPGEDQATNIIAQKINNAWQVIFDGDGYIMCQAIRGYDLPREAIDNCIK
ncbi:hypothetical protein KKA15_01560 [Patescibacteria group bacterium]|nr:hypothetical protein [Patescibacteria group bacterium]